MGKVGYVIGVVVICAVVAVSWADTITDNLIDDSLWSSGNMAGYIGFRNIFGDPLGDDDGYEVSDDGTGYWEYKTGWSKITAVHISQTYYFDEVNWNFPGGKGRFRAYEPGSSNTELPDPAETDAVEGEAAGWDNWLTLSYNDVGSLGLRGVRIDGTANDWSQLAGTVVLETEWLLGNRITGRTKDRMHWDGLQYYASAYWYDADSNPQSSDGNSPGNIHIENSSIGADPLDEDDPYTACGWTAAEPYWFSYKADDGRTFMEIELSFARYNSGGSPLGSEPALEYWNGSDWSAVTAEQSWDEDLVTDGWHWSTRIYKLGALDADELRVYCEGEGWTPRVGTAQLKLVPTTCAEVIENDSIILSDLNQDCYVEWADFGIFASQWQSCNDPEAGPGTCDLAW